MMAEALQAATTAAGQRRHLRHFTAYHLEHRIALQLLHHGLRCSCCARFFQIYFPIYFPHKSAMSAAGQISVAAAPASMMQLMSADAPK